MQSELAKAARDFLFLFIVDGGDRGISLDDIDPMEFSQKFADLEAALSTDAEPVGEIVAYQGALSSLSNGRDLKLHVAIGNLAIGTKLYATPPEPAVAVKELRWKGPDSSGEYHSLDGLWGYIIRAGNGNGFWLTEIGDYFPSPEAAQEAAQTHYAARIRSTISAQVQDVSGNEDLDENALSLAAQAYQRKFRDMLDPAPTEEPKAGGGPLGYAIRAYMSSVSVKVQDSDALESNPETLRWWCQQLLDIIENYDISHDAPEEEIALMNDIRAAVDPAYNQGGETVEEAIAGAMDLGMLAAAPASPASPASKHGDAE